MCLRESEIDQGAIAHVACDKAPEPSHNTRYALLVSRDDLPKILRIKAGTEHCRSDQIDEHDCKLPMFGDRLAIPGGRGPILFSELDREGCTTVGTEFFARRIFATASLTHQRKRGPTVATEVLAGGD